VWELAPAHEGGKGEAVAGLLARGALDAALYAGDDVADLEAFAVLDRAADSGLVVVKVAVLGAETPLALQEAADLVVEGPGALVALLEELDR